MVFINGVVYEKGTSRPIENATVIIGKSFALSHETGEFSMEVPSGIYDIVVIQRFYKKVRQSIEVFGDLTLRIEMERG
jgi:hypothetical protein